MEDKLLELLNQLAKHDPTLVNTFLTSFWATNTPHFAVEHMFSGPTSLTNMIGIINGALGQTGKRLVSRVDDNGAITIEYMAVNPENYRDPNT